ncbi:MAG: DivIVA domain-containing protein [Clostridiales bacterium]|nr:DivIVA domain-containing protein [Clostridiales bacterium]
MPDFKIVRKGYDTFEVNRFIENLQKQIDEYKTKENYINQAMISAEIAASDLKARTEKEREDIISKAKAEAAEEVEKAKAEGERLLSKTHNQIALIHQREAAKLEDLKIYMEDKIEYLAKFKADYEALGEKYFKNAQDNEYNNIVEGLKNVIGLIDGFNQSEENQ